MKLMYICLFKQLIFYCEKSTNLPVRQHLKSRWILRRVSFKDDEIEPSLCELIEGTRQTVYSVILYLERV